MAHRVLVGVAAVVVFFGLAGVAAAQITTGQILGSVVDSQGGVVPSARIDIKNDLTGQVWAVQPGADGLYNARSLPVGRYSIEAESAGFKRFVRSGIDLGSNEVLRINIELEVGRITESVTVVGEVSPVNTTTSILESVIASKQVNELPLNGRNILSLVALTPGAYSTGIANNVSFNQQSVNVNGNRSNSTNMMLDGSTMYYAHRGQGLMQPPPDAMQEVKVITSGVSAEYSRGSAVISTVSKSGTNEFHGAAWNYFRNDVLDARSFFALTVPKLRYNQFGGAVGGPVVRNKAFFFGTYQGLEQRGDILRSTAFPLTEAEKSGDFSSSRERAPIDPLTRLAFPGARIPTSRLDPVSQKLAAKFPLPNQPDGRYIKQLSSPVDNRTAMARFDLDLTQSDRTSVRYFIDDPRAGNRFARGDVDGYSGEITRDRGQNVNVSHSHTFSTAVLMTARLGWTRFLYLEEPDSTESLVDLGSKFPLLGELSGPAVITVPGRFNAEPPEQGIRRSRTHEAGADVSWLRGRHEVKFGGLLQRLEYGRFGEFFGRFTFNGQTTQNAGADFMLGTAASLTHETPRLFVSDYWSYGFYIQDNWRVTPRLSLNLGLRWEVYEPFRDAHHQQAAFIPGVRSRFIPEAPAGAIYAPDPEFPYQRDALNLGPRIGFAYDVWGNGKTSVRGGYALSYDPLTAHQGSAVTVQPFGINVSRTNLGPLSDPYRLDPFDPSKSGFDNRQFNLPMNFETSFHGSMRTPYTQNVNFTLEQQVAPQTSIAASYVASLGRKLPYWFEQNVATFVPGTSTAANTDQRRIYFPNFRSIVAAANAANSNYHGFQLEARKRFSAGFMFSAAYARGKAIDETGTSNAQNNNLSTNPFSRSADRGLGDFDARNRLVFSWLAELPFFRNQQGILGKALGGWQWGAIAVFQDGRPFSVTTGRDQSLQGVARDRPNLLGDPKLSASRPKAERLARYFDTGQFALNPLGQFGNAGRNILAGPGTNNIDMSLIKAFPVSETKRLLFRWELFNAFNRAGFSLPVSAFTNNNFGRITSSGAGRIMQLALKFEF